MHFLELQKIFWREADSPILTDLPMKRMKRTFHCKKRNRCAFRSFCIFLAACFLAVNLSGCTCYHPLRLSQLREFEQNVRKSYPLSLVSCKYDYGAGVFIQVTRSSFDEECAYTILGYLKPIVCDEEFIRELFELFEKESHGEPNWKNGMRPDIYLNLTAETTNRYQFSTRANKEGYNSGRAPDSYTWDGYTTWYGTEIIGKASYREISPEEIEEAIKQYSFG